MSVQRMIIGSVLIAVVAISCQAPEPAPEPAVEPAMEAAPESGPPVATVNVEYKGGVVCATVDQDPVTIYTERPDNQPQRVRWVVDRRLGFKWRFVHKGGDSDLIGPVPPVAAGAAATVSGTSSDPGEWRYRISMQDPTGEAEDCQTRDPLVIINE